MIKSGDIKNFLPLHWHLCALLTFVKANLYTFKKNNCIFLKFNDFDSLLTCCGFVFISIGIYDSRPNLMLYLSLGSSELVMYFKLLNLLFIIQCRYISLTIKGALLYTMYFMLNTFYHYFKFIITGWGSLLYLWVGLNTELNSSLCVCSQNWFQ